MDNTAKVNAIKGIHLFPGLPDEKLLLIAEGFEPVTFAAGATIFPQGGPPDSFYVVVKGKVDITRKVSKTQTEKFGTLVPGDYFGETAVVRRTKRNAMAIAATDVTLLKMSADEFQRLRKNIPKLGMVFDIIAEGRALLAKMRFDWRENDEVVYYITKRDAITLVQWWFLPGIFILIGLIFFVMGWGPENEMGNALWLTGIPSFVVGIIWAFWRFLDWRNDYYAITNRRVIFKEKVIGIYESRTETLLSAIRAVSVETSFWDRYFDSGSVIITTFTGKFKMDDVNHPRQVSAMIEEYWGRAKRSVATEQKESMRSVILNRIAPPPPLVAPPAATPTAKPAKAKKPPFSVRRMFMLRHELEGSITYHKHWYVLFRDSWFKILLMVILFAITVIAPFMLIDWITTALITGALLSIIFIYWFLWDYANWNNDIYMVTKDKVVDIYKIPFGLEQRKDAPLVNIQSMEYERHGIIGNLLNFGNVHIEMGGSIIFDFVDVFDPPGVQNDISRRLNEAIKKKQEQDAINERAQMLNFIADYHSVAEELRKANPPKL